MSEEELAEVEAMYGQQVRRQWMACLSRTIRRLV